MKQLSDEEKTRERETDTGWRDNGGEVEKEECYLIDLHRGNITRRRRRSSRAVPCFTGVLSVPLLLSL